MVGFSAVTARDHHVTSSVTVCRWFQCCDGTCPPCDQQCNKPLACRTHKCSSRCHRGPCYPCPETVTLTCSCKATKITVPCGREKVTRPPRCNLPCK